MQKCILFTLGAIAAASRYGPLGTTFVIAIGTKSPFWRGHETGYAKS